ncbi:hypothetical protein O181_047751 [Austropuccinia psidii MF-1]|uniref:Uncharacterized protein n=1 Tax=Austropuccinia psidii MF-1 TaxID=1389203 RepID=A0A9Q3DPC8_9BASI|nr:hypothetical protein [Austropuccinia psidii MF-1]
MSSKLTELMDASPSAPPPSVLCGSGILSWLASPCSMAFSGHFDPGQTYDGYKEVERDVARWTNVGGAIQVGGRPIYYSSAVPISRINTEGALKRIRRISNSPPDPDAEGCDELDGEEVEVVNNPVGHQSSTSPSQPPSKRFQSYLIPSTPRNFQPTLPTIPTSPSSSHTRPSMNPAVRPSPIQKSRASPIVTSQ